MKIIYEPPKITPLGSYSFDTKKLLLEREGEIRKLTPREGLILHILYENKGQVVKRNEILEQYWGKDDFYSSRSLDVFIANLRKYLIKDQSVEIITIRSEGLKLTC